jgi:hypothetical protein
MCEGVEGMELAQDKVQQPELVNTVKEFRISLEADSFLINRAIISLSRRTPHFEST